MSDSFKQVPSLRSTTHLEHRLYLKEQHKCCGSHGTSSIWTQATSSDNIQGKEIEKNKNKNKNPLKRVVERKDIGYLVNCSSFYTCHYTAMSILFYWNLFLWALAESRISFGECLLAIYYVSDFRHRAKHEGSLNENNM